MSSISLLYGHDSRSGQRSYRIVAQSADLAREQLAKVEALITRLCFDVRVIAATPGYFALWLTSDVRILGRFSVQVNASQETLEGRMVILTKAESEQSVLNWLQYLEVAEHWQPLPNASLPAPQLNGQEISRSHLGASSSAKNQMLPWDLIASNALEVITSWYLGLPVAAQKKACIVAPCLCPQRRIQDYLQGVYFIAGRESSAKVKSTSPNRKQKGSNMTAVILLCLGVALGYFFGKSSAPEQIEPKPAKIQPIVAQSNQTSLEFTVKQEKELEALCQGLRSVVDQYAAFEEWNQQISGIGTSDDLKEKRSFISRYLAYAGDPGNSLDGRLKQLSYAMGEIGALLVQPEQVSESVNELLASLDKANGFILKMRSSLTWQKDRATPDFKKATKRAEALIEQLEQALRDLKIRIEKRNDDVDAIRAAYSVELQEKRKITL